MEQPLEARLFKLRDELQLHTFTPQTFTIITIGTLEAIRAHINETLPFRAGDITSLDETIEILADYR